MSPKHLANPLHGILLIVLFSFSAFYIADFEWVKHLSLSPLIVGIVLGMLYANSLRNHLPETWVPGIQFCTKQVLRTGIVLYGFKLTFQSVIDIGGSALALDLIVVTLTIILGAGLGRLLKMDRDTALLTSIGSSICGAAAVLGAEPVVKSKPYKAAVAVSTVVIFGTLSMFLYPALHRAGILDLAPEQMGLFTGATLHEVAHVVGAGNAMGQAISDPAIIVKMIRCNAPRHLIELRQVSYITCQIDCSVQGVCIDSASPLQAASRSPQSTASSSSLATPSRSILSLASASRCITLARSLAGWLDMRGLPVITTANLAA